MRARQLLAAWLLALVLAGAAGAEQLAVRAYGLEDGLAGDTVTAVVQDSRGYLWFGTTDGVSRFDGERFINYGSADGLPHARVNALLESRDGTWWAGTQGGLARLVPDRPVGRPAFERVPLASRRPEPVFALFEDRAGRIWAGGAGRLFVLESGKAHWTDHAVDLEGLPTPPESIDAFAETQDGSLWIGTQQGLLRRLPDGRTSFLPVLPHIGGDRVLDLKVDREGLLWIVHTLRVFVLKPEPARMGQETPPRSLEKIAGESAALPKRPGEVLAISKTAGSGWRRALATGDGRMRLISNRALFLWDGELHDWTEENGLSERSLTALAEDRDGNLWLGTRQGVSRLTPEREPSSSVPSLWITAVRVDGVPQRVSELGAPRVSGIELESGHGCVEIEFLGLSFAPGKRLAYQYRMEGFEREWSRASSSRSVLYARLPPGSFRFLVRAVAPEERASSIVPAEVFLTVHPPLWRRAWVLALIALALAGGAVALYRYRVSHLLALERMRTRIATDLHDDLGSSLSRISILSEVARRRAESDPEGARLVTDIGESAREMMESLGESIWAIDPRRDDLRSLVTRIRRFAGDLLEARGIAWSLHAPPDSEQVKLSPVERRQLYLIFKEALHNAARHSDATSVSMSLAAAGRRLTATIRDDGKGFAELDEGETRRGLGSMNARAARLGGELAIQSVPGRGTEIKLEIPLSGRIS
ncbi:MAG TPA: two-component regulator propeller domain-containing protein [Thermoanaerobaculia bacterium]|nr:two-component regulator propeller domain-containing protein [Thermoanaerobaculia bacterium]